MNAKALIKQPWLNGWPLFWVIMVPISTGLAFAMTRVDLATGPGVSTMIGWSVRCAIPLLLIAFSASALQILRPGGFSLWLLRNRKFFGLAFAGAMAWQAFFILWLVLGHTQYYIDEVYVMRDAIEGVIGYTFLIAMTVTSFMPVRRRMRPKTWMWLHKIGIYSLWIYAFATYWWSISYYEGPGFVDYLYYLGAFLAWGLRALAWRKKRIQLALRRDADQAVPATFLAAGGVLVVLGLIGAATGPLWQAGSEAVLYGYPATRLPELFLPYWPFEPFMPLMVIGLGLWLTTQQRPLSRRLTAAA